ncbi:hypothetical protein [Nostoc sp.]|uniref:hypothetical protein n=1 Tax=Nostoc sp. TaxID=1180 RepID=UPI002FF66B14
MSRLTVPPNFVGTSGIDTLAAEESNASVAIGIDILNQGVINTFSGNDSISGIGTSTDTGNLEPRKAGTGIGINNSGTLNAGNGNDSITGTGTGTGGNLPKIKGTLIIFSGAGSGTVGSNGTGISNSATLNAGSGNDTITGTGTGGTGDSGGSLTGKGGKGGTGIGISNSGSFDAGDGNDTITGTGTGGTGGEGSVIGQTGSIPPSILRGESGDGGAGIGISNSDKLNTGKGEDTLIGTGTAGSNNKTGRKSSTGGTGIGIQNIKEAIITTGENTDTIKGSATSLEANTLAYGIFNDGIIDTGNGHDILTGQATTTIGGTAYGIYGQGIIRTGDGNDKVTATSNIEKVQQKVTIGGGIHFELGAGNDYFKGFGSAIVDGGNGFDTLDVRAFKRSDVSVSGVISGNSVNPANITFNNNGNLITLSTTGFENFIFADSSFSYSRLT